MRHYALERIVRCLKNFGLVIMWYVGVRFSPYARTTELGF